MEGDRTRTDESLDAERQGVDKALRDAKVAERAADVVVGIAREEADAVLLEAREKADLEAQTQPVGQESVEIDRAVADEALVEERATADERLRLQREARHKALAKLLPMEREKTDQDLLTERVRSDQAIASRDDFLAIVSHDLRNLLGAIVLTAEALDGILITEGAKQVGEAGKRIQRYAARMNRLIGDLLDVVSIDAGNLACTLERRDPTTLIAETIATYQGAADGRGVLLGSDVRVALPLAVFDYERMLQVFANLVSNALKFTTRGGEVSISAEQVENEVQFSVKDTGVGIPAKVLPLLFLRFWQSARNDPRGSGLGFYISKCLVEAQGGRIWVQSTVGKGSVFHFTVPVASGSEAGSRGRGDADGANPAHGV